MHADVVEYSPVCVAVDVRNVDSIAGSVHMIDRNGKLAAIDCTYRMSVELPNILVMSHVVIGESVHSDRHVMPV